QARELPDLWLDRGRTRDHGAADRTQEGPRQRLLRAGGDTRSPNAGCRGDPTFDLDAALDDAGARAARQAQGVARPHRQERRQRRRQLSERSPQDALWRYRASADLRRSLGGRSESLDRRGRRGHAAADATRRPELAREPRRRKIPYEPAGGPILAHSVQ